MFGKKKMSNSGAAVMAMGRKAGNLKEPNKTAPKAQPPKKAEVVKKAKPLQMTVSQRQRMGSLGVVKT